MIVAGLETMSYASVMLDKLLVKHGVEIDYITGRLLLKDLEIVGH